MFSPGAAGGRFRTCRHGPRGFAVVLQSGSPMSFPPDVGSPKGQSPGELHHSLRAATRADHVLIDAMVSRLDFARREDYGLFLRVQHAALQALKAAWRREDVDDFRGMTRCLQDDLQGLGEDLALPAPAAHAGFNVRNRLGIAYVIRGSRLGAGVLRRRVSSGYAASYLDFSPALSWTQFLKQLDRSSDEPGDMTTGEVILGAKVSFQVFSRLLTQALG